MNSMLGKLDPEERIMEGITEPSNPKQKPLKEKDIDDKNHQTHTGEKSD